MKIRTALYCLKQGLVNIKRNKLFSLASISTIAACVFLIGMFYTIVVHCKISRRPGRNYYIF